MVVLHMKGVLKYAVVECGWPSMTVGGATMMHWWCADNWDILINVNYIVNVIGTCMYVYKFGLILYIVCNNQSQHHSPLHNHM